MENLDHWNLFADIDPKFTKAITGKQYKGTSPNPQYVIRCLTEMFGPVGIGFGWRVVSEEFREIGGETLHWCRIEFWHTDRANVVESYGQTKAAYVTGSGKQMVDEDAPKKSLTDAIIKAASWVGIGANIFLGRWDDIKHMAQVEAEYKAKEKSNEQPKEISRNPREVANALISTVGRATTYAHLNTIIATAKFDAAWAWLGEEMPAMSEEVKAAVNAMRNRFDPAAQAPDDRAA